MGILGLSAIVDFTRLFFMSAHTPDISCLHPGKPSMTYRTLRYPNKQHRKSLSNSVFRDSVHTDEVMLVT